MVSEKLTSLRIRAFRVTYRRDGNHVSWIVFEDVERGRFRVGGHTTSGAPLPRSAKLLDTWNVLNVIGNALGSRLGPAKLVATADWAESIDGALSLGEAESRHRIELMRRALGRLPDVPTGERTSTTVPQPAGGDLSGDRASYAASTLGQEPSADELQRMIEAVWDLAGGRTLRWKPTRLTKARYKCEVLTLAGSEEILVGPTSIDVPARAPR